MLAYAEKSFAYKEEGSMSFYLCASSFLSKGSILSGEEGYSCPKRRMCPKRGTFPKRRVYPKRRMFPMRHRRRYVVFVGAYCSWSFPSSHRVDWPMRSQAAHTASAAFLVCGEGEGKRVVPCMRSFASLRIHPSLKKRDPHTRKGQSTQGAFSAYKGRRRMCPMRLQKAHTALGFSLLLR